jgi:Cu/Ag efflux protein CusF
MLKHVAAICLIIAVLPLLVFAEVEKHGTVVKINQAEKQIVVRTDRGEETLLFDTETKGLAKIKEGAKVTIKFTEKSGEPKVIEIIPYKGDK